jgi:hypothetical protein
MQALYRNWTMSKIGYGTVRICIAFQNFIIQLYTQSKAIIKRYQAAKIYFKGNNYQHLRLRKI